MSGGSFESSYVHSSAYNFFSTWTSYRYLRCSVPRFQAVMVYWHFLKPLYFFTLHDFLEISCVTTFYPYLSSIPKLSYLLFHLPHSCKASSNASFFFFSFFVFLKNFYKSLSQNWWPILGSAISSAPNVSFLKELFLLPPNRKSIICVLLTVLSELFIYSNGFPALICMLLRGSDNVSFNTVSQPLHM